MSISHYEHAVNTSPFDGEEAVPQTLEFVPNSHESDTEPHVDQWQWQMLRADVEERYFLSSPAFAGGEAR